MVTVAVPSATVALVGVPRVTVKLGLGRAGAVQDGNADVLGRLTGREGKGPARRGEVGPGHGRAAVGGVRHGDGHRLGRARRSTQDHGDIDATRTGVDHGVAHVEPRRGGGSGVTGDVDLAVGRTMLEPTLLPESLR